MKSKIIAFLNNFLTTVVVISIVCGNRSAFASRANEATQPYYDKNYYSHDQRPQGEFDKSKIKSVIQSHTPKELSKDSNPFGLVHQNITYKLKGKVVSFDLAKENVLWHNDLIDSPIEIGQRVAIEIQNGNLNLSFKGYTQTIEGLDIQAFTKDNELLVLLSKDGTVWVINIAKLHDFIFKGPIPVFKVYKLKETRSLDKIQFITANLLDKKPYPVSKELVISGLNALIAGDLCVVSGKNVIREVVPREIIMDSAVSQTILLKLLTLITDGKGHEANKLILEEFENIKSILHNPGDHGFSVNSQLLDQIHKIPRNTLDNIINEIRIYKGQKKHSFTLEEWQNFARNAENYLNVSTQEESTPKNMKDSSQFFTQKMKKAFNSKNLLKLAATFKLFILAKPPEIACKFMDNVREACTAVWVGSGLWDAGTKVFDLARIWVTENTPIVLGKTYLFYNTLSTLSLYSMFAAILVTGGVAGYFTNKSMNKTITTVGLRFIAYTVGWLGLFPFKILRQHNLPLASENKTFSKNAFNSLWASKETIEIKRKKLIEEIASKKHLKTNAMIIAYAIISEKTQIDPAALILSNMGLLNENTEALTPSQVQKWTTLSSELEQELPEIFSKNILEISGEDIAKAFETAKQVQPRVDKILSSPWYESHMKIKSFGNHLINETPLKVLKSFPTPMKSYKFYKKLKYAEIDDFTANLSMNKFKVEFAFMPFFYGWLGAYANPLNTPDRLSCNPNSFMWTNPRIRSEMMEQLFLAIAPRPAMRYLVFGTSNDTPFEYAPLVISGHVKKNKYGEVIIPSNKRETITESLRSYIRHGFNFRKAQYGTKFLKTFETMIETINSSYFSGLFLRTIGTMGGITFQQAFFSLAYMKAMSTWYFGWILIFSIRALQLHEQELTDNYQYFLDLIGELDRNIRFGEFKEASLNFKKLIELYPQEKLPHGFNKELMIEVSDKLSSEFKMDDYSNLEEFTSFVNKLSEYSTQIPPVAAAPHKLFMSLINGLTTGLMTLIATYLTLNSYSVTGNEIIKAYGLTFLLYTGAFYGLNTVIPDTIDYFKELMKPKLEPITVPNKKVSSLKKSFATCKEFFKFYGIKKYLRK